jgi:hypothetical protein
MLITLEGFLHQQGQRVHAAAHVGMARRDPYPDPHRNCDHCRRPSASAATAAVNIAGSTAPVIRIRAPFTNSISIAPEPDIWVSHPVQSAPLQSPFAKLLAAGASSHTAGLDEPRLLGQSPTRWRLSGDAATNRCFSVQLQRRRRSTVVMTSIRPFVM